jgi:hypothetical protein
MIGFPTGGGASFVFDLNCPWWRWRGGRRGEGCPPDGRDACLRGALRSPLYVRRCITKLICEKEEEKRGWVGSFRIACPRCCKKKFSATHNASAEQVRNRGARNKAATGKLGVAPVPYPGGGERGALTTRPSELGFVKGWSRSGKGQESVDVNVQTLSTICSATDWVSQFGNK